MKKAAAHKDISKWNLERKLTPENSFVFRGVMTDM